MGNLEPFNPRKHKPVQTVGASRATEYLVTEKSPEGKAWNIPTIWFNKKTNKPTYLKGDKAWNEAVSYEKSSGKKFPRFKTIAAGVTAAKNRSKAGGASNKTLVKKKKSN